MINTSLEITENEYLIKLDRGTFDLSFIRNLMKILEVSKPSDYGAIADKDFSNNYLSANPDYFSHLDEK